MAAPPRQLANQSALMKMKVLGSFVNLKPIVFPHAGVVVLTCATPSVQVCAAVVAVVALALRCVHLSNPLQLPKFRCLCMSLASLAARRP